MGSEIDIMTPWHVTEPAELYRSCMVTCQPSCFWHGQTAKQILFYWSNFSIELSPNGQLNPNQLELCMKHAIPHSASRDSYARLGKVPREN
jgi:hypothetical protein